MSFIYPASPVVGQDYTINGKLLRYNGIGFIPSPQTSDQAPTVLTDILPTDYIGGRRSVTGAEWTFETLRDKIFANGGASTVFVSTADEFVAAIRMEHSIVEICITKPITVNPFSNVYADNVYLTGCEITLPDGLILCNKTSNNTTTNYLINNALLYDVTDPIDSVIVVTGLGGMARTWNITVREFKTTRRLGVLVTDGCELNLITGNTLILDTQQLVGTYTATVDATLDLGQEDIRLDGSNVLDLSPSIWPGDKMLIKKGNYNFELVDVASLAGSLSGIILGSLKYETTVYFTTVGQVFEIGQIPTGYELRRIAATSTAQVNVDLLCTYPDTTEEQVNSWYQVQGNLIMTVWDLFAVSKAITPLQGVGKFETLTRYTRNTHVDNIVVSVRSQNYTDTTMLFKVLVQKVI